MAITSNCAEIIITNPQGSVAFNKLITTAELSPAKTPDSEDRVYLIQNSENAPQTFWWNLEKAIADGYADLEELYDYFVDEIANQCGVSGGIESIVAGTNITVDDTDPLNPIVSASGGGSSTIYYEKTFLELRTLMTNGDLEKGAMYMLTDFQTIYDQPDFNSDGSPKAVVATKTGSIEHLVFVATSDSTFADEVSSIEYIYDKIKFEWNYTATEIMGAPAKGRIIERITNSFNRTDFDSRAVLFKRYESAPSSGEFSSCFDNGNAFTEYPVFDANSTLEVTIGDYYLTSTLFGGFSLPNIVMKTGSGLAGTFFAQMEVKSGCYNITWLNGANNNIIGTGTNNCLFKGIFVYNYIGFNATNLIVNGNFANNYLGENWLNVTFNGYAEYNSFWDRLENCTFGDNVYGVIQYGLTLDSTFGDDFTYAVLYGVNVNLTVGNDNKKLKFWDANNLVIGNNNSSIDFASTGGITASNDINGVKNVVFSSGITGFLWSNYINPTTHPEMYNTYPKTVFLGSNGSVYSRYFNGTNDVNTIID